MGNDKKLVQAVSTEPNEGLMVEIVKRTKKHLYRVDGGIGKNIMFTSLIPELNERDGETIIIEASYPEVFLGVPGVDVIYNSGEPKDIHKFYNYFDTIYDSDPYTGSFIKGNVHVLQSWREKLHLPKNDEYVFPILNDDISEEDLKNINSVIGDKPYFVIQISGGQSPYEFSKTPEGQQPAYDMNPMRVGRNMGKIDDLYFELKKQFPNHTMVQLALPNEPKLKDAIQLQIPYKYWFPIFKNSEFFVGIDSMMSHAMAYYRKPGIVFWDMNSPEQFGWDYKGRFDFRSSLPNGVHVDKNLAVHAVNTIKQFLPKK